MKFQIPLVSRKRYEKLEYTIARMEVEKSGLREELAQAQRFKKDILPRLCTIDIAASDFDSDFETYRVCANIHRDMVERAFTHGGDDAMIRHTARMLAREIERKIVQFNFARCYR